MKQFNLSVLKVIAAALLLASCQKTVEQSPETASSGKVKLDMAALKTESKASLRITSSTGNISMITTVSQAYLSTTNKISFYGNAYNEPLGSITDGNQTVSFNPVLIFSAYYIQAWGTPPDVESALDDEVLSLRDIAPTATLTLSKPSTTFGFEMSAYFIYNTISYQVDFYSGPSLVGTINQDLYSDFENGNAKLFAAKTTGLPFDKVVISALDNVGESGAFVIKNIRYSATRAVDLDIKPQSCPNSFNPTSNGVLPAAVLGTASFNVSDIDLSTITLNGVAPLRSSIEDVSTPKQSSETCTVAGPDGNMDLSLKFDTQQIRAAMGTFNKGDNVTLTLKGKLKDGTPLEGKDVVFIVKK